MGEIAVGLILVGLFIIWRGWRGRRMGREARCPAWRCGYPLVRTEQADGGEARVIWPARCPECGCVVEYEGAAKWGTRRIQRWKVAMGLLIVVPGALLMAERVRHPYRGIQATILAHSPDSWVVSRAIRSIRAVPARPNTYSSTGASYEMMSRMRSATPLKAEAIRKHAAELAEAQTDTGSQWSPLGELLQYGDKLRAFSEDDRQLFFDNAWVFKPEQRFVIGPGDVIDFDYVAIWRGPNDNSAMGIQRAAVYSGDDDLPDMKESVVAMRWKVLKATLGGKPLKTDGWSLAAQNSAVYNPGWFETPIRACGNLDERISSLPRAPETPGVYPLEIELERQWHELSVDDMDPRQNIEYWGEATGSARPVEWFEENGLSSTTRTRIRTEVEVRARPARDRVSLESMIDDSAITATLVHNDDGSGRLTFDVKYQEQRSLVEAGVYFLSDVWVESPSRQIPLGSFNFTTTHYRGMMEATLTQSQMRDLLAGGAPWLRFIARSDLLSLFPDASGFVDGDDSVWIRVSDECMTCPE